MPAGENNRLAHAAAGLLADAFFHQGLPDESGGSLVEEILVDLIGVIVDGGRIVRLLDQLALLLLVHAAVREATH
jgi:multisubunit Na+/H+ antiporter MnhB subunit